MNCLLGGRGAEVLTGARRHEGDPHHSRRHVTDTVPVRMRVGVVDIGTNSTRLLVAEVDAGALTELERRTTVTRLGEGLEASGRLSDAAIARVSDALAAYRKVIDRHDVDHVVAEPPTSMRDADNGQAFREQIQARYRIDARTISGDEEARLTFLGATIGRDAGPETV